MKHYFKTIQGWSSFVPWYKEAVQKAPKSRPSTFVELGTWKGKSAAYMGVEIANSGKPIKFYTIDWFQGSDEPAHHNDPIVQSGSLETHARHNLRPVSRYVTVVKSTSVEASKAFADESISFVFIDAGHTYELVSADLQAWFPKVEPGGVIAGDDYRWKGVRRAVDEFFVDRGLKVQTKFGAEGDKCWKVEVPK